MKNIILLVTIFVMSAIWSGDSHGAWLKTRPTDSEKLKDTPALIRANWDAIELGTDSALQITNAKVSASAGIVDTKLANITTAGKVSGSAITGLSSVPSGAGALPLVNGGTGQTTRQGALDALLDTQSGQLGKALVSDGTNASWGFPTSLTISSATTGDVLYYNGTTWTRLASGTTDYALVSNGTGATPAYEKVSLTAGVQGTLPVANGGTGATSLTDIGLPSQTSNSGKYLTTNGSTSSWGSISVMPTWNASDSIIAGSDADASTSSTGVKVKEIAIYGSGSIKVSFKLRTGSTGNCTARVYKNGSAIGTNRTAFNTGGETFIETFSGIANGDLIQIYASYGSASAIVSEFRILASQSTINM